MTAETQKGPEPYGMATHLLLPHHTNRCAVRRPPPHATHNTLLLITLHQGENLRRLRQALRVLYGTQYTSRGHPLFKQVTVELSPIMVGHPHFGLSRGASRDPKGRVAH